MKRLYLIIYILFAFFDVMAQRQLHLMSFNCENAFDTKHDDGKNDFEYNADGFRRWNMNRLHRKLDGIAKVIAAADTVNPVGLVGLCEVENDSVMDYLTRKTPLKYLGYKYVITDSEDARGVDVALLYSSFVFRPFTVEYVRPVHVGSPTRDILHVGGCTSSGDTLDVYVVHLPSKLGGKEGERKSRQVAEGLKSHIDSVMTVRHDGKVVVMGDFNAEYKSSLFRNVLKVDDFWSSASFNRNRLYDVTVGRCPRGYGSYKYRGVWSIIDHILVSGNVSVVESGILVSPFLLENDDKFGGKKPRRTYVGYKYNGGVSDHLPVWMRVNM